MSRFLSSFLLPLALGLSLALPAFSQSMGGGTVGVRGLTTGAVIGSHLNAVNSPTDEQCVTYEGDTGGFEFQSCIAGAVTDVTGTLPITSSGGLTPVIAIAPDGIDFTEIIDDMTLDGDLSIAVPAANNITIDSRTTPSTHTLGIMRYEHTAAAVNTRVIELEVDANSFANTHAVRADLHATALAPGEDMIGYHITADKSTSTGGVIEAFRVDAAGAGLAEVHALHVNPGIDVIHQKTGTFGAIESAWENAVEVTSELNDAGTDLTLFSSNSDILYIGDAAAFNELEVNLDTFAGGAGIKPTFEYSNDGAGGWAAFPQVDGTDGFRETGIIEWDISDLTNWQTDTVNGVANKFWIRITRTQVSIPVDPIEDTIQILKAAEFGWSEDAVLDVANINVDAAINDRSDFNYIFTDPNTTTGLLLDVLINPSSASGASDHHYGIFSTVEMQTGASETGGNLIALEGDVYGRSGAAVTSLTGVRAFVGENGASTATDIYSFYAFANGVTNATNSYGFYIEDQSGTGTSISEAIHVEGGDINLVANGQYLAPSGTVGAPSYADTGDRASGVYFPSASEVGLVAGGVEGIHQTTTEILPLLPINMADRVISRSVLKDTAETINAIGDTGGGAQDIDLTLGNVVTATQTVGATTYSFINPASGSSSFTLELTNGGSNGGSIFPGSVTFVTGDGSTPTLQTSGIDLLSFFTVDGGSSWIGYGPVTGIRSLWIPASEWVPTVTNGAAALASTETTAIRPDIKHIGFASGADDFAQVSIAFPTAWDNGVITFKAYWAHAAGSTFNIDLGLQCVTITDDETIDVAYGSAVIVEDVGGTAEDLYITAESGDITCGGTPADGEITEFQIYRDTSGDDLDVDLDLIGVKIFYTVDANT